MQNKERLDITSKQLDRVLGFFARVEAKASFIFAVNSTLLALIALNFHREDFSRWSIVGPAALSVLLIGVSLFFVYRCSFPSLKGGSNSLIYFREIAKRREAEYVEQFSAISEDAMTRDFTAQIWRNSEILTVKYDSIKIAFILSALSLLPCFIFLLMVTIIHSQVPIIK